MAALHSLGISESDVFLSYHDNIAPRIGPWKVSDFEKTESFSRSPPPVLFAYHGISMVLWYGESSQSFHCEPTRLSG